MASNVTSEKPSICSLFYDVSSKLQLFPELLPDFGLLYIWEAFQIEEYSTPTKSAYLNGGDRTHCVSP